MILTRSDCTCCNCPVKRACFIGTRMPVVGHLPPSSVRGGSSRTSGDPGPRVVFLPCRFGDAWRFKSSCRTIRVCVSPRRNLLRLDADWSSTCLELVPQAGAAILTRWTAELELYPNRRRGSECGGLKSCLILDTFPGREMQWRRLLRKSLSNHASWRLFDWNVLDFLPPAAAVSSPSGIQQ
jgi:hypothetical protein